jgi:hypothetical protein
MVKVQLNYNPYTVKTEVYLNGKSIENNVSPLTYVTNKRLQEWIEPKGSWPGFFKALRTSIGERTVEIEFTGTFGDFEDLVYARDKFGDCFDKIDLIHKNKDTAKDADPYQKMIKLRELYQELQDGPIEEFKTEDIQRNFDMAINSDFRIVIVAPMSSGKSTLINAVLGTDLLPAVNQATTAVITEVKDNDQFTDFIVNADDKYGNNVVNNKKATKEIISELNYMKDPNDPKGKEALIHLVQIEGPIPNLPSDMLNTVFVDTPGGNNVMNTEHEEMMDEAIQDENKSLILYVFNGAQLGTKDSNIILQKISNAMQNSTNGKQSRDRFLFVANMMDEYDLEKESYEEVIEKTILPQLANNGITEPRLFLASAQTAKLIRMVERGEELSEKEEEDIETLIKRFNRKSRMLPKYASLNSTDRDKLISDAEKYTAAGKDAESLKEAEKNKNRAAEINSGIPAIEMAIREYLQKYAITIKIKTVHDTFMKKVMERNMVDNCEAEWAASKENFDTVKQELQEKREKCDHSEKLQEFSKKVEEIKLDVTPIKAEQAKVNQRIDKLVGSATDKVKREDACYILKLFKQQLANLGEDAQVALDNALNNGVRKTCQSIVEEYAEYVNELDAEGVFNIGSYDIKKTKAFETFKMDKAEDMLDDEKYLSEEQVEVGKKKIKKKGIRAAFARVIGLSSGYETIGVYEDQQFVAMKQLIQDQVTDVQHSFDTEINSAIKDTEGKVKKLKNSTMEKLKGLDKMINDLIVEIDNLLISQEELQEKVKANEEKAQWIKAFVNKVDDLLTV